VCDHVVPKQIYTEKNRVDSGLPGDEFMEGGGSGPNWCGNCWSKEVHLWLLVL
jgi:hypothetical protein